MGRTAGATAAGTRERLLRAAADVFADRGYDGTRVSDIAQAAGLAGCAPQKCFVDHIESWSTNEVTINWNAPLAWVAAFLDDASRAR